MTLINVGQDWKFQTESDLEEIIWRHLPQLFNLCPLSRQFSIDGKFCDILATGPASQLVVIELKNTEDRYVIQQLTRYYDALHSSQPNTLDVDFEVPIRLVAIAPSFHADTWTDHRYSTLNIELITFAIEAIGDGYQLTLHDMSGNNVSQLLLPPSLKPAKPNIQISDPPRKLLNWLSKSSTSEFEWVLQLRRQVLSFDSRVREIVEPQRILYGRGKTKPCCELRDYKKSGNICCWLWLPHPENKPHIIRTMVIFDPDTKTVDKFFYCPKSYNLRNPWWFPGVIKKMQRFKYDQSLEKYKPFLNSDMTISPTNIVNLALHTWQDRL